MLEIADRLDRSNLELQLILICGRNDKLRNALRAKKSRLPRFVEGFTTQVNYYMQLADFFIGKPGPGSVSEALAMKLPVIVECNAWTLPQERYNAVWVVEKEVGLVLKNFRNIDRSRSTADRTRDAWRATAQMPRRSTIAPSSKFPICSKKSSTNPGRQPPPVLWQPRLANCRESQQRGM